MRITDCNGNCNAERPRYATGKPGRRASEETESGYFIGWIPLPGGFLPGTVCFRLKRYYSENTVRAAFGLLCFYFSGAASLEVRFARFPHEYFQEGMVMQKTFFRARAAAGLISPGAHTEGQSS